MWLRRFTDYLLQHRWQTLIFVFALTFVPVIGAIGIMTAALVVLRKNIADGTILAAAAILPYIISMLLPGGEQPGMSEALMLAMVSAMAFSSVLTWAFAVMLKKHAGWSTILQVAALLGVLIVSVVHLLYPHVADWWGTQLQSYYQTVLQTLPAQSPADATSTGQTLLESVALIKHYATGIVLFVVLFIAIVQLIVVRWWEAILYQPKYFLSTELHNIRLSRLAGILFVLSWVLAYYDNRVVLDVMPVLVLLFVAAGLSLIHYFFRQATPAVRLIGLSILYITLLIPNTMFVTMVFVAMLALLDSWLNLRKRFKKV